MFVPPYGHPYGCPVRRSLYPEEQVPDLIDYLRVSACLSAWEALEGGEHEVRGILEVEDSLHTVKVICWLVGECAVFHCDTPLSTPFAINLDTELRIHAF